MSVSADSSRPRKEGRTSSPVRSSSSPDSDSGKAAERLTDDLLVDILSRLPAKSICRFKCVSNHWLGLINHPDHRKRLSQTLAGFFYGCSFHFTSVSVTRCRPVDTSFGFLPNHRRVDLLDCCSGLLLCRWYDISTRGDEFRYVVFNPATEKWVMFPGSGQVSSEVVTVRLGFDPAWSSHFHVFELVEEQEQEFKWGPYLAGVAVYSSETGEWVYKAKTWNEHIRLITCQSATVFLNGYLHFLADGCELSDCLAVVDTKGETWMNFHVPDGLLQGFIQRSQGQLHYANFQREEDGDVVRLVVYVLENYQTKEWILKHSVETSYRFGGIGYFLDGNLAWIAIHPECDLIFFITGWDMKFVCIIWIVGNSQ